MIKHIVMWKFKEGTEEKMNQFLKGLNGLVGQIEVIRSLQTGVNINPKEKFSATLICEFDNMEDMLQILVILQLQAFVTKLL